MLDVVLDAPWRGHLGRTGQPSIALQAYKDPDRGWLVCLLGASTNDGRFSLSITEAARTAEALERAALQASRYQAEDEDDDEVSAATRS